MNKIHLGAITALMSVASNLAFAGNVDIQAGVGGWGGLFSGNLGRDNLSASAETLGLTERETYGFGYLTIEHLLPVLPHLHLQATHIETFGNGVLSQNFEFAGVNFQFNENIQSEVTLTHADAVFYYRLLDHFIQLDAGLNLRWFQGDLSATNRAQSIRAFENFNVVIPMGYLSAAVNVPLSGLYLGGDLSFLSARGSMHSDIQVKAGYEFEFSRIDLGIEVGYRTMQLTLEDVENIDADLQLEGAFAGVSLGFSL